jgi:hypothetical protein
MGTKIMSKPTAYNFFATAEDIRKVLRAVEESCPLLYVRCGLFDESERPVFRGFSSLPELGVACTGQSHLEPTFLVLLAEDSPTVRIVPQRRDGNKYAVDQQANPGTVTIRPGGIYENSTLIAGMVGTIHKDEKAATLMNAFSGALKRGFTKTKSYLVGPEAKKLLALGMRLTHSVSAPAEFDLSA